MFLILMFRLAKLYMCLMTVLLILEILSYKFSLN